MIMVKVIVTGSINVCQPLQHNEPHLIDSFILTKFDTIIDKEGDTGSRSQ